MNKNISPAALTHNPKANPEPAEFKLLINTTQILIGQMDLGGVSTT